ncbi:AEC family transporter [Paracoccus chinensis]|uniref:Malate transporter n=1 Tax=Paracoccus chinensis TaxID=525640 RepID=A0A1G9FQN1_9RHOB|nr:AEC family transporter [Paracoccus chinensis]SDK90711.1 hypothetical protein SAMN04487971_10450 [Paracoccus chinensis]
MLAIFLKTLPFFALIGTGWLAGWLRLFSAEATAALTRFVFYFALSAMLFGFAAALDIRQLFDPRFALAYVGGSTALWLLAAAAARSRGASASGSRGASASEAAMLAHTSVIGNTGFLGVPMLVVLLGPAAIGPVLMVLTIDLVVFSTLITLIVAAARHGRVSLGTLLPVLRGLIGNPMIVAMLAGLGWSALRLPLPAPATEFLTLLGGAATPGALFAIGASLALQPARLPGTAATLSFAKLVLHPASVALAAWLLAVEPTAAGVMVAAAALPVAGNVYILAHHFRLAEEQVSTAILLSTAVSILTLPLVIHLITKG